MLRRLCGIQFLFNGGWGLQHVERQECSHLEREQDESTVLTPRTRTKVQACGSEGWRKFDSMLGETNSCRPQRRVEWPPTQIQPGKWEDSIAYSSFFFFLSCCSTERNHPHESEISSRLDHQSRGLQKKKEALRKRNCDRFYVSVLDNARMTVRPSKGMVVCIQDQSLKDKRKRKKKSNRRAQRGQLRGDERKEREEKWWHEQERRGLICFYFLSFSSTMELVSIESRKGRVG